jgi:ketosteroid isomerase-like protein
MTADLAALEARVRRLEDQDAVWRLFVAYKDRLDRRDFAGYAALFADDGEWLGNLGKARGPAEIQALLERTMDHWAGEATKTFHLVGNPAIDVDGDRATAESMWCYLVRDENDRVALSLLGHYEDVLVRTEDGWKFQRRVAYCDIPYEVLDTSQ